jgi:hypothetical protein
LETSQAEVKTTDLEANPEETEAFVERQEVRNDEMNVDIVGALEK